MTWRTHTCSALLSDPLERSVQELLQLNDGSVCVRAGVCVGCKQKITQETWQSAFCMEPATVATVTVWLRAVWFRCPVLCVCVCVCVYKHFPAYTVCKCFHIRLQFVCFVKDGGEKTDKISSVLRVISTSHVSLVTVRVFVSRLALPESY